MGRQARIKRERREGRHEPAAEQPAKPRTVVLTVPLPGREDEAGPDGHFDDCEVCRALRAGDEAAAHAIIQQHPGRVDISNLADLDLTPFLAWLKAEGIDPEAD